MSAPDKKLLAVFILVSAALFFRVSFERTHFLSPDSRYYLEMAQHIADGTGLLMTHPENKSQLIPVTIWPAGYPLLIAGLAIVTSLSVFWASKVLNVLFLGACLLLLRVVSKQKAWLLGLVFCSYTLLEVFSYTWSEVPFLFFLLLFAVAVYKCSFTEQVPAYWWLAALLGSCGLFLSRYIGLFSVGVLGAAGLFFLIRKDSRRGIYFLAIGFLSGLVVLGYFYRNYLIAGHISGDSREFEHHETLQHFFYILARGLFNELMLFRHNYFKAGPDKLFWIFAALQFAWLGWVYFRYLRSRKDWNLLAYGTYSQVFVLVGLAYLLLLVGLRFSIPFDSFDFRMLSPVTLLVYLALLVKLVTPVNPAETTPAEKHIALILLFALLLNVFKPSFLTALYLQFV